MDVAGFGKGGMPTPKLLDWAPSGGIMAVLKETENVQMSKKQTRQ